MAEPDFTYQDLIANPPATSLNPLRNLANAARGAVCGLYRSNQSFLFPPNQNDVLPGAKAVRDAYQRFLDNMCNDGPLPALPSPPFNNGQCVGTEYLVRFRSGQNGVLSPVISSIALNGPIGNLGFRNLPDGSIQLGMSIGNTRPFGTFYPIISGGPGTTRLQVSRWRASIVDVTSLGGPDNCGGPGPAYPPTRPNPDDYGGPITYRDRGVDVPTTWRLPPVVIPVGPISFQPNLTVQIGEVNFNFDLRGAKILPIDLNVTIPIGGGSGETNPNLPGQNPKPVLPPELADKFDRLEDLLKDLEKCACPKAEQLQVNQIAVDTNSLNFGPLPVNRNKYCAIALKTVPVNRREQKGNSAPDVVYAGWAWFLSPQGYASERIPVDSRGKVFKNPGNFTRFAFTLYTGFTADAFELNLPLPPTPPAIM